MKKIRNDLTGMKFGELKVLGVDKDGGRKTKWICLCDCGTKKSIRADSLLSGNTKSCGCLKKEQDLKNLTKHHRHLKSKTRIYHEWQGLKSRCYNPENKRYQRYGGRGITVCKEWKESFESFYNWAMKSGYSDKLTIDRIDNDSGYRPENCRWATTKEQSNNRSTNIIVRYKENKITLMQLSEKTKISYSALNARYKRGDRGERLIRPVRKIKKT